MRVDLNGIIVEAEEAKVSPFDGAYQYGDGIFDTLRSYRGHLYGLDLHVDRLLEEAQLLQLRLNGDVAFWHARIDRLLSANDLLDDDALVRIQISRGGTPEIDLVATPPEDIPPVEFILVRRVGEEVARNQQSGVTIMSVQSSFARGNFPQIKSLNYLPSIMALRFARASGFQEACLLNRQGKVLEGATSNLFCVREGVLRTPPVSLGLLPGITRHHVLELASSLELAAEETHLELRDLMMAEEVFLTGSVKEIVPVVRIDGSRVGSGLPGPWTRRLQQAYHERVAADRAGVRRAGTG